MLERLNAWRRLGTVRCPVCHKRASWAGVCEIQGKQKAVAYFCAVDRKVFLFFNNIKDDSPDTRWLYKTMVLAMHEPK